MNTDFFVSDYFAFPQFLLSALCSSKQAQIAHQVCKFGIHIVILCDVLSYDVSFWKIGGVLQDFIYSKKCAVAQQRLKNTDT